MSLSKPFAESTCQQCEHVAHDGPMMYANQPITLLFRPGSSHLEFQLLVIAPQGFEQASSLCRTSRALWDQVGGEDQKPLDRGVY